MYGVFFVLTGILVFEGIYALPTSQDNDLKIRSLKKYPKSIRRMVHVETKPEFKSVERSIYTTREKKSEDKPVERQLEEKPVEKKVDDKSVENVISAIDTGVKTFMASQNKSEIINKVFKTLICMAKDKGNTSVFRSQTDEYVKPMLIHFRTDPEDKPTVMLELNSQSIINGLKDLAHSSLVNKLMQHYSKEAAVVYRSINTELDKPKQVHKYG